MAPARLVIPAVLLVSATARAQVTEFGAATFVPPAGWTVDSRPTMQTFAWAQGRDRCLIAMSAPRPTPPELDAAYTVAWRELFANGSYRRAERPASLTRTSPAGHRHAIGEGEIEDAAGNRLVARLHVFPIGAYSQWIIRIANGAQALASCRESWDACFASLRFRSVTEEPAPAGGAPVAAPPATPTPSSVSAATGAPQQFDNITFVPPNGWAVRRTDDLVRLSPSGARSVEQLEVLLLPGRITSESLERQLEGTWSEVRSRLGAQSMMTVNQRPYDPDEPSRSLAGVEYLKGEGGMRRPDGVFTVYVY